MIKTSQVEEEGLSWSLKSRSSQQRSGIVGFGIVETRDNMCIGHLQTFFPWMMMMILKPAFMQHF